MKQSGVAWLGEIPDDRQVRRLRTLADVSTGGCDTIDRVDGGIYPFFVRSQKAERINSYSFDGEAVLTAGDGAGVGKVFHYVNGRFDFHQRVYKFSNFRDVSGRYFFYYIREMLARETLAGTAKSTVDSLRRPMLLNFPVCFPPIKQQDLIVRYLDHAELRIGRAIQAKSKLADLLLAQRMSKISELVLGRGEPQDETRQYASLSESRVLDWISSAPSDWSVHQIAECFSEAGMPNHGMKESQVLSLSYGRVIVKSEDKLHGLVPANFETYQVVEPGDVIIRPTDLQNDKTSLRVGQVKDDGIITSAYMALRPRPILDPAFGVLLLAAYDFLKVFYGYGSGLRQNLSFKDIKHIPLPVPPFEVQQSIVKSITRANLDIEKARECALRQIQLLGEYRTRLISDVVTGKIDVQTQAAALPDIDPLELAEVASSVVDDEEEEESDAD